MRSLIIITLVANLFAGGESFGNAKIGRRNSCSRKVPFSSSFSLPNHHQYEQKILNTLQSTVTDTIETNGDIQTSSSPSTCRNIVLRCTKKEDLPFIIDLLTFETTSVDKDKSIFNWNQKLHQLKSRKSFTDQLNTRLKGLESSITTYKNIQKEYPNVTINDVWNHNLFADSKRKLSQAIQTSLEYDDAFPWKDYNLALPPTSQMMYHTMVTAFDPSFRSSEDEVLPIGFCEVACKKSPEHERPVPCIMNLVVSPNQRRRGIAQRMIRNAVKHVQMNYPFMEMDDNDSSHQTIGLYVDDSNENAISLYKKMGFQKVSSLDGQMFMEMNISEEEKAYA